MCPAPSTYTRLAAAYVRGWLQHTAESAAQSHLFTSPLDALAPNEMQTLIDLGRAHGLRLHRFKRTMGLPRVQKVLGILRGMQPANLLDLLTNIALFREFCREQDCYETPYIFANDHSRVQYFRTPGRDPAYAAYDDTTLDVVLMSGLPGAGKDTWLAAHLPDCSVIALDDIHAALEVDPADNQGAVVQAARAHARVLLRQRQSFAWNATNITRSLRRQLVDLFLSYAARVQSVYVEAPYADLLLRNRRRTDTAAVPEKVIHHLLRRLDVPNLTEAHTVAWVRGAEGTV